ncbi:MAG: DUF2281 domain-containing protein [Fimbriimonadales bacterium]|nr:DUF2281 domain-containing protein [Fimbriimonadales bacterium]
MRTHTTSLEELIRALPPEAQEQVREYVEFLHSKYRRARLNPLRLNWAGALTSLREQYASVELQHETLKEWGD